MYLRSVRDRIRVPGIPGSPERVPILTSSDASFTPGDPYRENGKGVLPLREGRGSTKVGVVDEAKEKKDTESPKGSEGST